ncbi:MAG: aspartate aminotransferase family protein [Candidatus Ranarchaeia archaeon]
MTKNCITNKDVSILEDRYLAKLYSKRPIAIAKGKGVYVWDSEGRKYLDLVGGHGVAILGHHHPKYVSYLKKQIEDLIICPGIFYNEQRAKLGEKISKVTPKGLDTTFLSNSGAEAVEAGLKLARRATGKTDIIAFRGGFHGRTFGSLAVTWNPKYRKPFEPFIPGVVHVPYGNIEAARDAITAKTAAIIVEPIQGETGVILPPENFLSELRDLCDRKNILLVCDEVQTGFGRTGEMFASNHWGLIPDILCTAKGIAGGIPMGATISRNEIFSKMARGEHGSTFGGNPLACAAANVTLDIINDEKLLANSKTVGKYFLKRLDELLTLKAVSSVRGLGLMLAVQLRFRHTPYVKAALEDLLLLLTSGLNTIRMLPPLILTTAHVDQAISTLGNVLAKEV